MPIRIGHPLRQVGAVSGGPDEKTAGEPAGRHENCLAPPRVVFGPMALADPPASFPYPGLRSRNVSSTLQSVPSVQSPVTPRFDRPTPKNRAGLGFAATILTSAFLLFEVQPLLSKFILPWFGGSPAVWTTAMLFFQVMLFAGYAYAHLLTHLLPPRGQFFLHTALLILAVCLLPIAPSAEWKPIDSAEPTWRILALLAVSVGLPYLVLASTGPLVQAWFSRVYPKLSPYRLYALSNVGSLVALLSYPFYFERARYLGAGLVVVGRLRRVRRAVCRLRVAAIARQGQAPRRRVGGFARRARQVGGGIWPGCAAGLRLGGALGDDEPCLPGRGRDPVFVGHPAGSVPGDVHHRFRSRALVSASRVLGRGGDRAYCFRPRSAICRSDCIFSAS